MGSRRHRNVAQVPTPTLPSCQDDRYSRTFCRPEDWDHPDGADNWVQAKDPDVDCQGGFHATPSGATHSYLLL